MADQQWYAVIDEATGEAFSFGTDLGDELPAGHVAIQIDHQPGRGEVWDPATRSVVAATLTPAQVKLARYEELRLKGWQDRSADETTELQGLRLDLGL